MPLQTCAITGDVVGPNGNATTGYVKFVMHGYDTDGTRLVYPSITTAAIASGAISVNLWPNTRGQKTPRYEVFLSPNNEKLIGPEDSFIGFLSVPDVASANLAELMSLPSAPGFAQTVTLSQAQYDALASPDPRTLYLIVG